MIQLFIIVNSSGQIRLCQFYDLTDQEKQKQIISQLLEVSQTIDGTSCNFIQDVNGIYDKKYKIIIRHYAALHFIMVIDEQESELGILDLIQVWYPYIIFIYKFKSKIFVDGLDKLFENACELDMVYFPDKVPKEQNLMNTLQTEFKLQVNALVDEIIVGGTVVETNLSEIVEAIKITQEYEDQKK